MKKRFWCTFLLLVALIAVLALPASATSGNMANIQISGIEDYDEANEVLRLVNEARAGEGLPALTMNPYLSNWAMQRAAECAVYYDHARPNGYRYFSIYSDGYLMGASGENIAAGYHNAAAVTNGWLNSPGHYANIMNTRYQSIGIGCFYQEDGTKSWVQLFSGYTTSKVYEGVGKVSKSNVSIEVREDFLDVTVTGADSAENLAFYTGQKQTVQVKANNLGFCYANPVTLNGGYTLSSSNTAVFTVSNNTIKGVKAGTADLKITFTGSQITKTIPVTVQAAPVLSHKYSGTNAVLTWTGDSSLQLFYKEKGDNIWSRGGTGNQFTHYSYWCLPGETYTYQLRYWNGDSYVSVGNAVTKAAPVDRLNTPQPTISNVASHGGLKLKWAAVPGAVKYEIYRSTASDGKYILLSTVKDTTYTNVTLTAGKAYYYKVRAIAANSITSANSDVVSGKKKLPQPVVTAANIASTGKIKLTWDKVEGATGYEIYRATSQKGTYVKLSARTDTTYTNVSITPGVKYFYKVRAVCKNAAAASVFSSVAARTCDLAQPQVTISSTAAGKIKMTWNKVEGATGYEIYRATSKNGTYIKLSTRTGTTYTNESIKTGTTYYYKVKAVCKNEAAESVYSTVVSKAGRLARPTVSITFSSSGKPKLSWDAVSGAVKYEVYRANSKDGTYVKLGTTTSTTYTNKSAAAGKTYYYKVRSVYSKSAGTSVFSAAVGIKSK